MCNLYPYISQYDTEVSQEELDAMTFQMGMVTTEGVLLASDRQLTSLSGTRFGRLIPKIEFYENENFAHCSAGDNFCEIFTDVIRTRLAKGVDFTGDWQHVRQALRDTVTEARGKEAKARRKILRSLDRKPVAKWTGGHTMLVFRGGAGVTLWTVDTSGQNPTILPVDMGERAIAGDKISPALFFIERYFKLVPKTLDALIPLAAHTVLMAESDYVGGLQIGLFTKDEFRILTDEELKPYIELSKQIDSGVAKLLLSPKSDTAVTGT